MKTSRIPKLILTFLGVSLAAGLVAAQAAEPSGVIRDYDVVVPPSQDHAFREGVKHWVKCLGDHGYAQAFYAYDAETGDQSRYAFLVPHESWAQIGMHTAAGKACRDVFDRSVAPHFTEGSGAILKVNAKVTHDPGESPPTTPLWWVTDFRIKPGKYRKFIAVAHEFAAAAEKTQWEAHFIGYDVMAGGQGSPQFMIAWPNSSWADVGKKPNPTARKMLEGVYGKAATAALYHNLAHSLRDDWSSIWSYDKELSFMPTKRQ